MLPRKKVVRWLGHCFGERYSEARRVYLPVGVIFNMHCGIKFVAWIGRNNNIKHEEMMGNNDNGSIKSETMRANIERGERTRVVIAGCGLGGLKLAMSLRHLVSRSSWSTRTTTTSFRHLSTRWPGGSGTQQYRVPHPPHLPGLSELFLPDGRRDSHRREGEGHRDLHRHHPLRLPRSGYGLPRPTSSATRR